MYILLSILIFSINNNNSVEYSVTKHLCERLQRGIEYLDSNSMWENNSGDASRRNVVISGGVASNQRMRNMLSQVMLYKS